ncbi:MAG: hypothetical protein U1C58_11180 [Flavobacteriaceae bacterium]|nr:hypothetical protein [Flavobacteriaceae bacterium]
MENQHTSNKYLLLFLSLLFDALGMLTFTLPVIGESFDLIWAPISGFLIYKMYGGTVGKVSGVISVLEEILPFTDVIPTFTLTWVYTFLIKTEKPSK